MSTAETARLNKKVDALSRQITRHANSMKKDMSENTKLTQQVLDKVSDRVSQLELSEARRQGREGATGNEQANWTKIILAVLGIAAAAVSMASFIAQKVLE